MGYPVLLNLVGRLCLVAGAGAVGRRRLTALLDAGAQVRLVAPELPDAGLPAAVEQRARAFREEDLDGVFLAIAATSDAAANAALAQAARRRGILCGRADQPQASDLQLPAVLRRGPLTVAVATDGNSPVLAALLRDRLAQQLGSEWARLTRLAGALRRAALVNGGAADRQRRWLAALLHGGIDTLLTAGDGLQLRRLLTETTGDEELVAQLLAMIGDDE